MWQGLPKAAKPGEETRSSSCSCSFHSNSNSNFLGQPSSQMSYNPHQHHQNIPDIILQDPIHLSLLEGTQRSFFAQISLVNMVNLIEHMIFRKFSMIIWKIHIRQQNTLNSFCPSRFFFKKSEITNCTP